MDIKITVEAPGLVQAIEHLATALSGQTAIANIAMEKVAKEPKKETPARKETPVVEEDAVEETVIDEAQADAEETQAITLVTVRSYLQKLQDAGRQKDAKAILVDLGHKKLSDVPVEEYTVILSKVEELLA